MNPKEEKLHSRWREFRFALSALTRLPAWKPANIESDEINRSLLWHTAVGLTIGLALVILQAFIPGNTGMTAIIILVAWVWISGSLHYDGMLKTFSLFTQSMDPPESNGNTNSSNIAFITTTILIILIAKFSALGVAIQDNYIGALVVACVLGRAAAMWIIISPNYSEPYNYGGLEAVDVDLRYVYTVIGLSCLLCIIIGGSWIILAIAICAGGVYFTQKHLADKDSGVSGNTAACTVEVVEVITLWFAVL